MFGKNKILKAQNHDGLNLDVQEIFPTLQGEGPFVGYPSVFIRLGGCNLACAFCDTEFESYKNISLKNIIEEVLNLAKNSSGEIVRKLIVITGGEPLRQPIERLCEELIKLGFDVQIETNGTIYRELPKEVKIICSPKTSNGKYHQIRPDLLLRVDAFKFIISENQKEYLDVAEVGQAEFKIPIYIQPMDEYDDVKNQRNLEYVVNLAQENGYILSLQTHKIIGLK
jgi:7-carboxy-7-deazaguanine synthase